MRYSYAYQNSGGPLLSWKHGPPPQTRAAPSSLGSLGDHSLALVLPRPGAPEPINGSYVSLGCSGCKGAGGMGDVTATIKALPASVKIGGALALAYLLRKHLKKR